MVVSCGAILQSNCGEEAPYLYNERANVSALAGASWRSGCVALEEFQGIKGYKNKKKENGRVDLWIANGSCEELIEAKYKWICMAGIVSDRIVGEVMGAALDDAKKTQCGSDAKSIGVGFFPVYKSKNKITDIDELIEDTIQNFLGLDYHALAWCFPKEMRDYTTHGGNQAPGIFLLAKNLAHC